MMRKMAERKQMISEAMKGRGGRGGGRDGTQMRKVTDRELFRTMGITLTKMKYRGVTHVTRLKMGRGQTGTGRHE